VAAIAGRRCDLKDRQEGEEKMLEVVEHTEDKLEMPLKFRIIWGKHLDESSVVSEYEFATQAEVNAFWEGVEDAQGWDGYTMLEDGDTVPENDDGEITFDEDGNVIVIDAAGNRVERDGSRSETLASAFAGTSSRSFIPA
jgi:hypothetical protein